MKNNNKEIPYSGKVRNGFAMLALVLLLIPAIIATSFILLPFSLYWIADIIAGVGFLTMLILLCGFFVLQPNQARKL